MGNIRLLPDHVASQVAAGEVVERPASVVKELVENSIDAKATRIDVEYRTGGLSLIAVSDNGHGMDREDALLCLERHATSKIRTGGDLAAVATFGFRGEALPSIASVSKFRLTTRETGALAGTEVVVAGGRIETVRDCGEGYGTRIEARSLFYNLPARRKFLRGERTETAHIDSQFQTLALARPDLCLSLTRDGRTIRMLPPTPSLATRIRDLCGGEFLDCLFEIGRIEADGLVLAGFLGRPGGGRASRTSQFLFVNGRAVASTTISQPLREAYGTALPGGMHPAGVILIEIAPDAVDCNVHPAKREVRFRDPIRVRQAVLEAAQAALAGVAKTHGPPASACQSSSTATGAAPAVGNRGPGLAGTKPGIQTIQKSGAEPVPPQPPASASPARIILPKEEPEQLRMPVPEEAKRFDFVGKLGARYLVMQDDRGLVLLDNRAARERILFEGLLRRMRGTEASSQRLLIPALVDLLPRDFAWVSENASLLSSAGLLVDAFGISSVRVEGIPPALAAWPAAELLVRIVDDCRSGGRSARHRASEEALARSVCRHASLAGLPDDEAGVRRLVADLLRCDLPYACPNGRPTMLHFSFSELERKFGGAP